jgi:poly-gamma-glutamate synthesis protein (capsule biosynthesis protein)
VAALVLEASGDLVLNALAMRAVRAEGDEAAGYRSLLAGYAEVLSPDALTFLNLEMPLVDTRVELDGGWPRSRTEHPRRAPVLGATPALAEVLDALGVDVVSVANNHSLDQGHRGLRDTLDALERARIGTFGAGPDRDAAHAPFVVERAGVRIAFLGGTDGVNHHPDDGPRLEVARADPDDALLAAIEAARPAADLVVVAIHWSSDFVAEPTVPQRHRAERMIAAGADVILGTGPHVLQPIELASSPRGDALVAYSLGNLASGMGRAWRVGVTPEDMIHPANVVPEARDGVVLRIEVRREREGLALAASARLLFTENDWLVHRESAPAHLRVVPLEATAPETCRERLVSARAALGPAIPVIPDSCPPVPTR